MQLSPPLSPFPLLPVCSRFTADLKLSATSALHTPSVSRTAFCSEFGSCHVSNAARSIKCMHPVSYLCSYLIGANELWKLVLEVAVNGA